MREQDKYKVGELMNTDMSYVKRNEYLARCLGYTYIAPSGLAQAPNGKGLTNIPDFSTWESFGKLWIWTQEQKWFDKLMCEFYHTIGTGEELFDYKCIIHPDRFANVVYSYLREEK